MSEQEHLQQPPSRRRSSKISNFIPVKKTNSQVENSYTKKVEIFESRQDVAIMMNKLLNPAKNCDFFSDSEDELCTLKDDMEEYSMHKNSIFLSSPQQNSQSASSNKDQPTFHRKQWIDALKKVQVFEVVNVSRNRKLSRFPSEMTPVVTKIVSNHNDSIEIDETCIDVDSEEHSTPAQFKRGVQKIIQQKMTQMQVNSKISPISNGLKTNYASVGAPLKF